MDGHGLGARLRDERGAISSLFIWAVAVFLLIGVTLSEVGHCIVAKSDASNAAGAASESALDTWRSTKNVGLAQNAAIQAATNAEPDSHVVAFSIDRDGSVTVTVEVTADTLVVSRISAIKRFGVEHSTATTSSVSGT